MRTQSSFSEFKLTPEAKSYALRELAKRAGVSRDFFRTWIVDIRADLTQITFRTHPGKSIIFRHAPAEWWRHLNGRPVPVARATWMCDVANLLSNSIPDFVVPYADPGLSGPLFFMRQPDEIECRLDLLASMVLNLVRAEEVLNGQPQRDEHGRFPATSSAAFIHKYSDRPVVDEYGLGFEQALRYLLPAWRPLKRSLRVKLTHDIDQVGLPFNFASAIGHTVRRRSPVASLRDLCAPFTGLLPAYLRCTLELAWLAEQHGLRSAMYWKASPPTKFDSGYNPLDTPVLTVIRQLREQGIEHGVHPGYDTFQNSDLLVREVDILRNVIGEQNLGGRQHYLRWSPSTWTDWERCGLSYDSSVGYAEFIGFRSGTCHPYRPWLLSENREAKLLEIPLIVMSTSLPEGMGLMNDQCLPPVMKCIEKCELVGGVFTLLWHNDSLLDRRYGNTYIRILRRIAGCPTFESNGTELTCSFAHGAQAQGSSLS
jgi:hypothetical protein